MTNKEVPEACNGVGNYPDKIVVEEIEEENPTAFTLLTKIEDPYYARKQSNDCAEQPSTSNEEIKSSIQVYESFYASPKKSGSSSTFSFILLGSVETKPQDPSASESPLSFKSRQRPNQELKRYSSAKNIPRKDNSQELSSFQQYVPQYPEFHRTGVSTPPPGLGYYDNNLPVSYNMYMPYDPTNSIPSFPQIDPGSYIMQGYYPMYVNYQPYPQSNGYYTPPTRPAPGTPTKKKCSVRPSQFCPHKSSFSSKDHNYGEHTAENEELVIAAIKEFEKEGNLNVLKGKIAELAATQTGSRFLQRQLTKASPSFVSFVLTEVPYCFLF